MSELDATNPGPDDDALFGAGVDDTDFLNGDGDLGDGPGDGEGEEEELEDYEVEGGKTLQVSKSVKEALEASRLRQADYTRKTQELAEQRRATDAERAATRAEAESHRTFLRENAQLLVLDEQLAAFDKVDWDAALDADQVNGTQKVTAARMELERLRDARAKLAGDIDKRAGDRTAAQQQETAKLIEARDAALIKEFPKWVDERPAIEVFAKANGITEDELKSTTDPRVFKMLKYARLGFELEQRRKAASTLQSAQQVKPVPALNAARKGAPTSRDQDRMSTADWMKMERQRLAKKSGGGR